MILSEENIKKFYCEDKLPIKIICKKFGCSKSRLLKMRKRYNILNRENTGLHHTKPFRYFQTKEDISKLKDLFCNSKLSENDIAKEFHVSCCTLHKAIRREKLIGNLENKMRSSRRQRILLEKDLKKYYIQEGLPWKHLLKIFHCNGSSLKENLKKYKIKMRGKGTYHKSLKNILAKYYLEDKLPFSIIADHLGISENSISSYLKKFNIPLRSSLNKGKSIISENEYDRIRDLYLNKKYSPNKIGKYYHTSQEVIRRFLINHKVPLRNLSESRTGELSNQWKGGRRKIAQGYILVHAPFHHRAMKTGYVFEHILIAEQKYGRPLEKMEIVHHLNGIKDDNRPENLVVLNKSDHHALLISKEDSLIRRIKELEEENSQLKETLNNRC